MSLDDATARKLVFQADTSDPRHGTANGYCNLGCRCDRCRSAWRDYEPSRLTREQYRRRNGVQPRAAARSLDEIHGTRYGYKRVCRCAACRAAHAAYLRRWRATRQGGRMSLRWHCPRCATSRTMPPIGQWGPDDAAWYRTHEPHDPSAAPEMDGQLDIFTEVPA